MEQDAQRQEYTGTDALCHVSHLELLRLLHGGICLGHYPSTGEPVPQLCRRPDKYGRPLCIKLMKTAAAELCNVGASIAIIGTRAGSVHLRGKVSDFVPRLTTLHDGEVLYNCCW